MFTQRTKIVVLTAAMATLAAISLSTRVTSVKAFDQRNGQLHLTKDCSSYSRLAGGYCTIQSSDFPGIPAGSVVHYDEAFGVLNPAWLDSNVVVDAGNGNKAIGRCTVDFTTVNAIPGVCTFSDGLGALAGFTARVEVTSIPVSATQPDPALYGWDGTYSFQSLPGK